MNNLSVVRKEVFHVLGEIDDVEGRGGQYSIGYYLTWEDAREAAAHKGLMDGDGQIQKHQGLVVNGVYLYLEDTDELVPLFHDDLSELKKTVKEYLKQVRERAATKLNEEEIMALGL